MPDYTKAKIYAIKSPNTDEVYIGSTCSSLSQRMASHRADFKRYCEGRFRCIKSFEIIDKGDAYIELVEDFNCSSKEQLLKREGEVIRSMVNAINRRIEGQTYTEYNSQYYKDNKEVCNQRLRDWREKNRDRVNEYAREWRARKKASQDVSQLSHTHPAPEL